MAKRKIEIVIVGDDASLNNAFKRASASTAQFGKNTEKVHARIRRSFAGMTVSAAKAGAAVGTAYLGFTGAKDAISTTEELAHTTLKLHRNLGLTVEQASRWAAVAKARGIDAKQLQQGFGTLAKNVLGANTAIDKQKTKLGALGTSHADLLKRMTILQAGAGAQADSFKKLGLTTNDLKNANQNFEGFLGKVADKFGAMKGGSERAALGMKLFGRGWQTLLPLMSQGSKGMNDQLALADKYGVTFKGKTVKSLEDLIKAQRESKFATMGLQVAFGTFLAPALTKALTALNHFVQNMRDGKGTAGQIKSAIIDVVAAVKTAAQWLGVAAAKVDAFAQSNHTAARVVRDMVKGVIDNFKGVLQVIKGVVNIVHGIFTGNWSQAWQGAKQVVSGAVKAIIGTFRTITAPFRAVADKIGSLASNAARAVVRAFESLPGKMLDIGKHIIQGLVDGVKSAAGNLANAAKSVANIVPNTLKKALKIFSPSKVMYDIGRFTAEGYTQGLLSAKDMVTASLNQAFVYPIDAAIAALNNKKTALQSMWDKIDAMAQRAQLVGAIGKAKRTTSLDASTNYGVSGGGGGGSKAVRGVGGGSVAKQALAVAKRFGATPKETKALIEAGIVESGLKNLNYGDRDSVGFLQQRPSQGWKGLMNVPLAALEFLQHARGVKSGGMTAGQLAQAVQRSAFPGRYDAVGARAAGIIGHGASGPTRSQLVSATKRKGADQGQIRDAIRALADFDAQAKRANQLAKIDIKVAHLEQLKAFKGAISDIRKGLDQVAQSAADAFRAMREKQINAAHDTATAIIADSADAKELARLQADDAQKADAKTTKQLNQDLADAIKSGDVQAQQDAQDAIDAYAQQKREQQLSDNLAAATQAADDQQNAAMTALDQEVADFQSALDSKLQAEATQLNNRKENYAKFLKDVQAIAGPYGISVADVIGASSDQEAAVDAGPGTGGTKPKVSGFSYAPSYIHPFTHRAGGGPVTAGTPYIVGERGQEVFVPGSNGRIVPNGGRTGMTVMGPLIGHAEIKRPVDVERVVSRLAFRLG